MKVQLGDGKSNYVGDAIGDRCCRFCASPSVPLCSRWRADDRRGGGADGRSGYCLRHGPGRGDRRALAGCDGGPGAGVSGTRTVDYDGGQRGYRAAGGRDRHRGAGAGAGCLGGDPGAEGEAVLFGARSEVSLSGILGGRGLAAGVSRAALFLLCRRSGADKGGALERCPPQGLVGSGWRRRYRSQGVRSAGDVRRGGVRHLWRLSPAPGSRCRAGAVLLRVWSAA